jgi:geranylgeranyl transferase type-2 subunit beta
MDPTSYLARLTTRLADGVSRLDAEVRQRHRAYLLARQSSDGGFPGREGGSDLYYTAFGLRGLAVLDALSPEVCTKAGQFLKESLTKEATVVDFFSLLYSILLVQVGGGPDVLAGSPADWPERVAAMLESHRTSDGGYARTRLPEPDQGNNRPAQGTPSGSTYHSFLVTLCYQLLSRDVPEPERLARFVLSRRRDDGGFVEIAPMRRSGTNPTAAAVGTLQILDALTPEVRAGVVDFLVDMASFEGGVRANGRAPLADLLSTFTAAWTLAELEAVERLDASGVMDFAGSAERAQGGFRGGLWDEGYDVEYTFYGLGIYALFAGPA